MPHPSNSQVPRVVNVPQVQKNIEFVHAPFVSSAFRHVRVSVELLFKFAVTVSVPACLPAHMQQLKHR